LAGASVELERFISDIELDDSCRADGEIITCLTKGFTPTLTSLLASLWNGYYCSRIMLLSAEKNHAQKAAHQFHAYNKLRYFKKCLKAVKEDLAPNKATLLEIGHDGICFFIHSIDGMDSADVLKDALREIDGITLDRISV